MPRSFRLSPAQLEHFETTGILRLPGFYDPAAIAPMADALWADLARRYGIARGDPATWTVLRPSHFQAVVRQGAFAGLDTSDVRDLCDQLLGPDGWTLPAHWGQPLVTFPAAQWDMPRVMWHFDLTGRDVWPLPGLRLFTFLEPVRPRGGGTLVVAGSCRLALKASDRPLPSEKMRNRLKARHPWIAELCQAPGEAYRERIGAPQRLDGCEVAVEEMTGEPGDVVLMHPLTLHGGSHNALDRPRMMLVQTLWRRSLPSVT